MTALMIILAVFVLIGIIPVGVDAGYINSEVSVKIKAAFVNIPVVPKKEKAPELNKKKKKSDSTENKTKKKFDFDFVLAIIKMGLRALERFRKKLSIDHLMLHYTSGGDDPYSVAMQVGYVSAAMSALLPPADHILKIRSRDIEVSADFQSENTRIDARLVMTIQIWEILYIALAFGFEFLRYKFKQRRQNPNDERMDNNGKHSHKRSDAGSDEQGQGNGGCKYSSGGSDHNA